jgi:predicted enzyme related to lactoylglutathione lyase
MKKNFINAISWFEIPSVDIDRAQSFYQEIFDIEMTAINLPNIRMRLFPLEEPMGVGGAICESGGFHKPSATDGPLIYLNGNPDLQLVLDRIEKAGGKLLVPKTQISPEYGYMAVFIDSEGNRIGLHCI